MQTISIPRKWAAAAVVAFTGLAVLGLASGGSSSGASTDPCASVYTANTTAKLQAYTACRDNRIDAEIAALPTATSSPTSTSPTSTATSPTSTTTSPSSTTTTTTPPPAQYGVSGTLKAVSGDVTLTDGQSIANEHISGTLYLAGNNVTATNVEADGGVAVNGAPGGNYFFPVKTGQTLEHVTTTGVDSVGASGLTIDASDIGGEADTFAQISDYSDAKGAYPCQNIAITNTRFSNLLPAGSGSKHLEALHMFGCKTVNVSGNDFDFTIPDLATWQQTTAAVTFQDSLYGAGGNTNVTFANNRVTGGGYYSVYLPITGSVTGNAFVTPQNVYQGWSVVYPTNLGTFSQSGNTLDGKPITLSTLN